MACGRGARTAQYSFELDHVDRGDAAKMAGYIDHVRTQASRVGGTVYVEWRKNVGKGGTCEGSGRG